MSLAVSNPSGIFYGVVQLGQFPLFIPASTSSAFLFSDIRRNSFLVSNIALQEGNIELRMKFIVIAPNAIPVTGSRGWQTYPRRVLGRQLT